MRFAFLAVAALAALAAALAVLLLRGEEPSFRGSIPPAELTLPRFAATDDEGRAVSSAELEGKVLAVTFLDTRCTEACPVVAAQLARAHEALGEDRDDVELLAFTVDPVEDTPARIDAFLARNRAKGKLRYLDGTVDELRPVWSAFGILAAYDTGNPNMHSAPVRVYDRDGTWRSTLHTGVDLTPANLVHDLRSAMRS